MMKKTLSPPLPPLPHAGRVLTMIPLILFKGRLGLQSVCEGSGPEGIGCKDQAPTLRFRGGRRG